MNDQVANTVAATADYAKAMLVNPNATILGDGLTPSATYATSRYVKESVANTLELNLKMLLLTRSTDMDKLFFLKSLFDDISTDEPNPEQEFLLERIENEINNQRTSNEPIS
jgi:hypothetical protein